MLLLWYSLPPIAEHIVYPERASTMLSAALDEDDELIALMAHFEFYE